MTHTDRTGAVPRQTWTRGLVMIVLILAFGLAQTLLTLLAVVQFLWLLIAGHPNGRLRRFGTTLGTWLRQTARYQACENDERPFPWADWPRT